MSTIALLPRVCVYCQDPKRPAQLHVLPVTSLPPRERPKVYLCDPCSLRLASGHISISEFQWL